MAFCTVCGANIPEGIRFCTECGKPVDGGARAVPPIAAAAPAQPVYTPPPRPDYASAQGAGPGSAYTPEPARHAGSGAPPPKGGKYAVMGTGSYFGHLLLFSIPVVGWIACIIIAFTAVNLNKRHFARAILIFILIGIVLSVVLYFVFAWILEAAAEHLNVATQGAFGELDSFFEIINEAGIPGK